MRRSARHEEQEEMRMRVLKTTSETSGRYRTALTLAALTLVAVLSGCGVGGSAGPAVIPGVVLHGNVHGGQQPVIGAKIQLYQASTAGYGAAATPLISANVTTGTDGSFNIDNDYTCTSGDQLYIVATGGTSGFTTNANLAMMTALTPCGTIGPATFIFINEVTTVGSVWAISPFMSGLASVGSSPTNTKGLANAFADVNTLVDTTSGALPGPAAPAGTIAPTNEIYTLANILASCVNSSGGTFNDGSGCGYLFFLANPGGTALTAPTDTITAAMNIAQHPGLNAAALWGRQGLQPPFLPDLGAAPTDFTIALTFSNAQLNGPAALAADASGDVWVVNKSGNTVTELSHSGAPISTGLGYVGSLNLPSAIAIDAGGGAWVTNSGNNTVSRLSSSGGLVGTPYSGGGLNLPAGISLDSSGNAWVSNSGNASVTEINSSGSPLTNYMATGITGPLGIGVSPH